MILIYLHEYVDTINLMPLNINTININMNIVRSYSEINTSESHADTHAVMQAALLN